MIAGTTALIFAYFVNDIIMSKLKIYLSGNYFVTISYPINLYGLYSLDHMLTIALNTWIYKMIFAIVLFPIAIVLANAIKRIEKLDYFDYGVSYNPMVVFSENVPGENKYNKKNNVDGWYRENYSNN